MTVANRTAHDWRTKFKEDPLPDTAPIGYRAFKPCAPGEVMSVDLVPADPAMPGYEISYFQPWTVRYLGTTMLAIFCPANELIVFIEGKNLDELRRRLRERRVSIIYEHDSAINIQLDPKVPLVTTMRVEMSNDLDAIHQWQKPWSVAIR